MIRLINISKKFRTTEVLRNISLEIEEGNLIYIKGSNGCGKSTLLKIIAGLLDPDSGSIDSNHLHIGALIENPCFIENETALFNLKFLSNLNSNFDIDKINELSEYLHLNIIY